DWHSAPFGRLQALPRDGRPVRSWPDPDEAFGDIARGIRSVAEEMVGNPLLAARRPGNPSLVPPARFHTTQKSSRVKIEIEEGDVTAFSTDVLILKYAQELMGADAEVVSTLESKGPSLQARLPSEDTVLLVGTFGHIEA